MRDVASDMIDYLYNVRMVPLDPHYFTVKNSVPKSYRNYSEQDKVELVYDIVSQAIFGINACRLSIRLLSRNTNCLIEFNNKYTIDINLIASGIACFIGKHKNEFVISKNLVDGFSNAVDPIAILNCIRISKDMDLLETIMHDAYELGHREILYAFVEWFSDNDDSEFTAVALRAIHNLGVEYNANLRL